MQYTHYTVLLIVLNFAVRVIELFKELLLTVFLGFFIGKVRRRWNLLYVNPCKGKLLNY